MKTPKLFLGTWRITETELWEADALDESEPAHITFAAEGLGAVQGKSEEGGRT